MNNVKFVIVFTGMMAGSFLWGGAAVHHVVYKNLTLLEFATCMAIGGLALLASIMHADDWKYG